MDNVKKCCCTDYLEKDNNLKLAFSNETYSIYGNLNKGEKIILKYFGSLITDNTSNEKKIFLNYGYGNLWTEKNICEMKLCYHNDTKCYCTNLELINAENLFFCFMDSDNNWDLNDKSSYMLTIDTPLTVLTKKTVDIIIPEDEYINLFSRFMKKLNNKLINLFISIGNFFDKKIKA